MQPTTMELEVIDNSLRDIEVECFQLTERVEPPPFDPPIGTAESADEKAWNAACTAVALAFAYVAGILILSWVVNR